MVLSSFARNYKGAHACFEVYIHHFILYFCASLTASQIFHLTDFRNFKCQIFFHCFVFYFNEFIFSRFSFYVAKVKLSFSTWYLLGTSIHLFRTVCELSRWYSKDLFKVIVQKRESRGTRLRFEASSLYTVTKKSDFKIQKTVFLLVRIKCVESCPILDIF